MKKLVAILLALVLVLSLFACGKTEGTASGNPVVKIGIYEPASGDNGAGGKQETLAFCMPTP